MTEKDLTEPTTGFGGFDLDPDMWIETTSETPKLWEPKGPDDKLVGIVMYRDDRNPDEPLFVIGTGPDQSDFYGILASKLDLNRYFGIDVTINADFTITLDPEAERFIRDLEETEREMISAIEGKQ